MSVEVKTPTRTQFEHPEFHCGDRSGGSLSADKGRTLQVQLQQVQATHEAFEQTDTLPAHGARPFSRKRKTSERGGPIYQKEGSRKKIGRIGRTGDKIVLPSKFLLGGNITDPLNLNALCDEEIGRALNETTPHSSPLPLPDYKQMVQVLIPPNINDPLNLNAGEEADINLISPKYSGKKKKQRHKKKRTSSGPADKNEGEMAVEVGETAGDTSQDPLEDDVVCLPSQSAETKLTDSSQKPEKLTSPTQIQQSAKSKKQNRLSSELGPEEQAESSSKTIQKEPDNTEVSKSVSAKGKAKRQWSHSSSQEHHKSSKKFNYGNYNRYYGYRNPGVEEDYRLNCFMREWFKDKDVLDVGCNIGHITLCIARDMFPKRIVGMDIDGQLISIAKKNVRHYMTSAIDASKFPMSLPSTYGPIMAPSVSATTSFPHNIMFVQGNIVLDSDEELELVQEEYDVILALSLTKWIHLNFGDVGLKRAFKRLHRQLRPGGRLIIEPQSWASYKKKKKLTDNIFKTFQQIRFRPDQFMEYLLSKEVGFVACEHIDVPFNKSKGFQRPIQIFIKAESSTTPVEGVTPLMDINCTPSAVYATTPCKDPSPLCRDNLHSGATPRFEIGSSGITPCSSCQNTPTYLYHTWSAGATPRNDSDGGATPGKAESETGHNSTSRDLQDLTNVEKG